MKVGALATMVAILLIGFPIASMAGLATDTDGDGTPDVNDNCSTLAQGGVGQPGFCDTDTDGYGNACDGDFNQDYAVTPSDFSPTFLADFGAGTDSGVGTDMNCDGAVTPGDFSPLFLNQFGAGSPGPSGLSCAGAPPCP